MVSGALIANMSDQHRRMSPTAMKAPRKPKLVFICCTAILLVLANSASAHSGSGERGGEVKTFQQLRSRGQSGEQYRARVLAESSLMMAKTSPIVPVPDAPVAVTEVYGRDKTQVVAPTNATVAESPMELKRSAKAEMSTGGVWASRIKRLIQSQGFQRMVMGNFMNTTSKKWLPTGNDLWDGILSDCSRKPSFSCMQKNMYSYLDRTLLSNDVNVTDNFLFIKNQVNYTDELARLNEVDEDFDATNLDIDPEWKGRSLKEDDTTEAGKLHRKRFR